MSDFAALPPEINSARMYAGPGSGPLLASAAAWDALTAELETFGAGYSREISALQGESWSGVASTAMAAAAAPYVSWVTTAAGQAAEAANQARAAAAAYEAAFAATVPPEVVAANRALLAVLVATNFLGHNTPAIAATEAVYAQMWAQDATAMHGYAVSASAAAVLTAFNEPPQTTNPTGQSGQGGAVGQAVNTSIGHSQMTISQLMSAVPERLQSLASGPFTSATTTQSSVTGPTTTASTPIITAFTDFDELDGSTVLTFAVPKTVFQAGSFELASQSSGAQASGPKKIAAPARGAAVTTQNWSSANVSGSTLASVGRSAPVGGLSVPQNWTVAATTTGPTIEPVHSAEPRFRSLPPWAGSTNTLASMPGVGQVTNPARRPGSNAVFRMRDRRYRMPRPAPGG